VGSLSLVEYMALGFEAEMMGKSAFCQALFYYSGVIGITPVLFYILEISISIPHFPPKAMLSPKTLS